MLTLTETLKDVFLHPLTLLLIFAVVLISAIFFIRGQGPVGDTAQHLGKGVYGFEYKGHSYLGLGNGGLIHAEHCECLEGE